MELRLREHYIAYLDNGFVAFINKKQVSLKLNINFNNISMVS